MDVPKEDHQGVRSYAAGHAPPAVSSAGLVGCGLENQILSVEVFARKNSNMKIRCHDLSLSLNTAQEKKKRAYAVATAAAHTM